MKKKGKGKLVEVCLACIGCEDEKDCREGRNDYSGCWGYQPRADYWRGRSDEEFAKHIILHHPETVPKGWKLTDKEEKLWKERLEALC
jgi:hypothetical protein